MNFMEFLMFLNNCCDGINFCQKANEKKNSAVLSKSVEWLRFYGIKNFSIFHSFRFQEY